MLEPRPEIKIARRNVLAGEDICLLLAIAENLREMVLHVIYIVLHQILERHRLGFRNGLECDLLQSVQRTRGAQLCPVGMRHQMM